MSAPVTPDPAEVEEARAILDAAREGLAALQMVHGRALTEGRRLRERAEAPEHEALVEDAALQERRAVALEPRIAQLRDRVLGAERAYDALRPHRDDE